MPQAFKQRPKSKKARSFFSKERAFSAPFWLLTNPSFTEVVVAVISPYDFNDSPLSCSRHKDRSLTQNSIE
jgi:hypothetical protein